MNYFVVVSLPYFPCTRITFLCYDLAKGMTSPDAVRNVRLGHLGQWGSKAMVLRRVNAQVMNKQYDCATRAIIGHYL